MPCGRGPLPHADHDRAVADDEDVAALAVGRVVDVAVVAVVEVRRVGVAEHRVEVVDEPGVDRLPLAGRLAHRVDRQAVVDPGGVVPLEQVVRQRRAAGSRRRRGTPAAGWRSAAGARSRLRTPPTSTSASRSAGVDPTSSSSGASSAGPKRVAVVSSSCTNSRAPGWSSAWASRSWNRCTGHALGLQLLDEGVVLLARPLGPHHVVEEQVVDVLRGEPGQLQARAGARSTCRSRPTSESTWNGMADLLLAGIGSAAQGRQARDGGGAAIRSRWRAGRPGCRAGRRRRRR